MNNPTPVLTIAIPTLNRLALLKNALASALAQTVPVEIIVSDNGSSDGTSDYLSSIELPENVRRFYHASTIPVQEHGMFLVSNVRTEWVTFLSDDDSLESEFAARIAGLVKERPDLAVVYTGCNLYFGTVAVPAKVGPRLEKSADFFFEFMNGRRNICMCATAFRVQDYRDIGQQPMSILIGDMYYWARILAKGDKVVGCVGERLANYFFFRPGVRTETNRASVLQWAQETCELASIMSTTILADPSYAQRGAAVARVRSKYLATTTSNQFAWNALRGASRIWLLRSAVSLVRILAGEATAPFRAVAGLILPRPILERLVLSHARRLATTADRP